MNKSRLILPVLFIGAIGLLAANKIGYFNRMRGTEITITNVGSDSTFTPYITNALTGPIADNDRGGCQIAIRAVGYLDDWAKISVDYPGYPSKYSCMLRKGKVDTVIAGDFYASTAPIHYVHQNVKKGHLNLSVSFSYPPESWNHQFRNGAWRKK